jgi:glycosyltransferase involved in cell wall biosynthesis
MAPTIVQIVPRLETGGSEQSAVEINAALVLAGATSLVVSEGGRLAAAIAEAGGRNIVLPVASKNPVQIAANIGRLRRLIAEHQVDLVHARSRAPAWSALFAAHASKRPFVTTYHGSYASRAPFKTAYNSVMARGDLVIANSNFTADLVHRRHGTPYERMPVVPRGVDIRVFDPARIAPARLQRLQRAWRVPPGNRIVLQAARLTDWKGQRHLIDAAAKLKRAGELAAITVVMAGSAQGREAYREEIERLIAEAGLEDQVRLVGHCDDMPAAFALAHAAVVCSILPETFGRTSIEAQAMGCPVIVTDIGAAPETIIAGGQGADYTGWVVPPADGAALAERLQQVLAMPGGQRGAVAARARRHVGEHFSLQAMQRGTLSVYDRLLGTRLSAAFGEPS